MKRIVILDQTPIPPFGEPARDLRILNKPLWLLQRDLLMRHCQSAMDVESLEDPQLAGLNEELLVHKDNLFFNAALIDTFIADARATGQPAQLAFSLDDPAITAHALRLQEGIRRQGDVYVADVYYFPRGVSDDPQPVVVDTEPQEMGYYHIPSYMAPNQGDLVFQVPIRPFLSIESWIQVLLANSPFGVFSWGRAFEKRAEESWRAKLSVSLTAFFERLNPFTPRWRKQTFLSSGPLVKVGKNCSIDPTAIIIGPTVIGNNVNIGPGAVISNSLIGNNVTIMQGANVMLSVVSDRCCLPFRAALFMTAFMDNSMVAQNTCLQLCVVGRNTFIGAGNTCTDFDLLGKPIKTLYKGKLEEVGMPVIGSVFGHNVKIGSGFTIYPARMIESNTVLCYADDHAVIPKNVASGVYTRPPVFYPDRDPRVEREPTLVNDQVAHLSHREAK
jgi:UDP-N-acetylglucosamine diphosphorylase / glucose-1-phosphate thymidylyltransferase / UDP-N-acetylgalactosamine diphosphorylase / glucosamine-1-phosphate N-acetyltransferase / galactosamine-1-phosphate N-acetyltransferase